MCGGKARASRGKEVVALISQLLLHGDGWPKLPDDAYTFESGGFEFKFGQCGDEGKGQEVPDSKGRCLHILEVTSYGRRLIREVR